MRILPSYPPRHSNRAPVLVTVCGLALAICLSGCASKNPLIDDAPKAEPTVATAPASTTTTTAAPTVATKTSTNTTTQIAAPTGWKRLFWFISPYRVNIQQGNFISEEMVSQIKEGMTKDQVRFVLGTPLISDAFHADRWDYSFRLQKGDGELSTSRVTVFFKDGHMVRFEGGNLPTEQEYIARIAGPAVKSK
jgi:outer membrane protein assembly factor BamE